MMTEISSVHLSHYSTNLILQLSIFKLTKFVLSFQCLSINMPQVHLKHQRTFRNCIVVPLQTLQMGCKMVNDRALNATYSMTQGFGESWSFFKVRLKELVSEMLGEESKHKTGSLWIRNELFPQQHFLHHLLCIWEFKSRAVLRQWGECAGVIGQIRICFPAFVVIICIVRRWTVDQMGPCCKTKKRQQFTLCIFYLHSVLHLKLT